jgi:transposase InsO family protein
VAGHTTRKHSSSLVLMKRSTLPFDSGLRGRISRCSIPALLSARVGALKLFLDYYNHSRPHQSIGGASPVSRRDAYFAEAGA